MNRNTLVLVAVLAVLVILLCGGCKNPFKKSEPRVAGPVGAKAVQNSAPAQARYDGTLPTTHTVQKGDTLWALASLYYGDGKSWSRIAQANGIQGTHIATGMRLTIPSNP